MAGSSRTLADGLLPSAAQALYTVPDGMVATIDWLSIYNNTAGNVVCTFFLRRFGSSRRFSRTDLAASGGHAEIITRESQRTLAEGDAIEGFAASGNVIEFALTGTEAPA